MEARYAEAVKQADTAQVTARTAKTLADERAPIQEPGTAVAVVGEVTLQLKDGSKPKLLSAGDAVPVGSVLRTAESARAEILLGDGSLIQVLPNTQMVIASYLRDRRDGRRRSRLNVIMGNILGRVQKRKHERSTYELRSRSATIAIRGTEIRLNTGQDDVSRLAVLGGSAEFKGTGRPLPVPTNFGTYAAEGAPPAPILELLPPPEVVSPDSETAAWGRPRYRFAWRPVKHKRFAAFHFELATDTAYNDVREESLAPQTAYETRPLPEGDYYWRVTTVDTNSLEGRANQGKLTIGRDMRVVFEPQTQPVVQDGVWVFGPGNLVHVVAASKATSVVGMEVSLGGETRWRFWEPIGRIRFTYEVTAALRARGIDEDGERGPSAEQAVRVDLSPPKISVVLSPLPPDPNRADAVRVRCQADDPSGVAHIEYGVDGKFTDYTGPFVLPRDQVEQLVFRAVDRVGNSAAWLWAAQQE